MTQSMTTRESEADTAEPEMDDRRDDKEALRGELRRIQERVSRLPVFDDRTPEEIIGYDENGLPT